MRILDRSTLALFGISLALASTIACGGTHKEADAPKTASNDVAPALGSPEPDPAPATPALTRSAPASETAKASTKDDGSDIIPPFPSAGGSKKTASAAPTKGAKKASKKKAE